MTLKRRTGINQWNILCRWAICTSLADGTQPEPLGYSKESNVEMTWEVFSGELSTTILAVFSLRAIVDQVPSDKTNQANYFRKHLERGIAQLHNTKNLEELLSRTTAIRKQRK